MKSKIILMTATLCCIIASILVYKIVGKNALNKQIKLNKQTLPEFIFYTQDLKSYNTSHINKNKALCIFYYNAECDHCQYEAKQLKKHINAFKDVQILMVSTNKPTETQLFAKSYGLNSSKFITWIYDKDFNFYKWFGNAVAPSVYIYNNKQHLVKEYNGEVKIEAILSQLNNDKKN